MIRTHEAGTLRASDAGQGVTLAGWVARRRDHGGVIFVDLRDASGTVQVVFREGEMAAAAHQLRTDQVVCIDEHNPYFQMIRGNWGQKLRQVFESLEDPQWGGGPTRVPLGGASPRYEPLKKITHPDEKIV